MNPLYTIGHSTYTIEQFLNLLYQHGITALADVRSSPYSKYAQQFNKELLKKSLEAVGIKYVFLGKELGARSENKKCYKNGKIQFELLAQDLLFIQGIARLKKGLEQYRLTIMCAEKDPLDCHRAILVSRIIHSCQIPVLHILGDGTLEAHDNLEKRMLARLKKSDVDLFLSEQEILDGAYRIYGEKIAYQDERMDEGYEATKDGE